MRFFVGLHQPNHAQHFERAFISINRLRDRKSNFVARDWILDSGAFTEVSRYGRYRADVSEYAEQIDRWASNGNLLAAVSQDYMCEPEILEVTGKTIKEHQEMTVQRYDALLALNPKVHILPVLQGYYPPQYAEHLMMYGGRLVPGMWVGVGSVCKRNTDTSSVGEILSRVKDLRPDLKIHGFGLKVSALKNQRVKDLLETSDSMAWSYAARREGRDANSWLEAKKFVDRIDQVIEEPLQLGMF